MTKDEIIEKLTEKGLTDILDIIRDAEKGYLEELELVEQIGLVHDSKLNEEVINLLKSYDVKITYIVDEEDGEEEE